MSDLLVISNTSHQMIYDEKLKWLIKTYNKLCKDWFCSYNHAFKIHITITNPKATKKPKKQMVWKPVKAAVEEKEDDDEYYDNSENNNDLLLDKEVQTDPTQDDLIIRELEEKLSQNMDNSLASALRIANLGRDLNNRLTIGDEKQNEKSNEIINQLQNELNELKEENQKIKKNFLESEEKLITPVVKLEKKTEFVKLLTSLKKTVVNMDSVTYFETHPTISATLVAITECLQSKSALLLMSVVFDCWRSYHDTLVSYKLKLDIIVDQLNKFKK